MKKEIDIYIEICVLENKISDMKRRERWGQYLSDDEINLIKEYETKIVCLNWVLEKENVINHD